jgi:molybdopterin converting factor subunit 1
MIIHVKLFAILREKAGTAEIRLEAPVGATVEKAVGLILEKRPELGAWMSAAAFAVNMARVDRLAVLKDGDELALLPPVSGG